jgi:transposase-like protein
MQQKTLSLLQFQKKFGTEKACQKQLFRLRWPEGFKCARCGHTEAYFHRKRHLYQCKSCGYQASLTAGTVFHKTRTPLTKWFWLIWLMGRQKSGVSMLSLQRMLEIKTYKTVWTMGYKIRQALADRDAHYKLAGLIEMDGTYFGAPKPGKRGRGAAGKAKVVVAVETPKNKPRFAVMHMVPRVSRRFRPWYGRVWWQKWWSKPTVGKDIASWMLCPTVMSGSFPVRGKRRRRSCLGSIP